MESLPPVVRIDDLDSSPEARDSFCSSLRQYSFAIVQLNPQSSAAWHGFHSELHQFFALTKDEKEALGPFRRIGGRMFGYRMDEAHSRTANHNKQLTLRTQGEREFVEIRRAPTKKTGVAPAMAEGTGAAQAWDTGCHVARTLLRVLSEALVNSPCIRPLCRVPRCLPSYPEAGLLQTLPSRPSRMCSLNQSVLPETQPVLPEPELDASSCSGRRVEH